MKQLLARPAFIAAGAWTAIYLLLCATGQRWLAWRWARQLRERRPSLQESSV